MYFKKSESSSISSIKSCYKVINFVIRIKIRHSPSIRNTSNIWVAVSGNIDCMSPTKAVRTVDVKTAAKSMSQSSKIL